MARTSGSRRLSYTEVSTAMTCFARWDMSYGGRLAGDTLRPRTIAPILSEGRAWGAAVAAWHAHAGELLASYYAHIALIESVAADQKQMYDAGVPCDPADIAVMQVQLGDKLDHYMATAEPLTGLTLLEGEFDVAIPSRHGKRSSNRYRYQCFIDGYTDGPRGQWIVEFKLRSTMHSVQQIELQRQYRWYAWALARARGMNPVGIIIDERWNESPRPPRMLKSGLPSHDKSQLVTPEDYLAVCEEHEVEPSADALEKFRSQRWQQRVPIMFREGELAEAGEELVAAGRLIQDLDSGALYPVRNASPMNCRNCRFREICANPQDRAFVDMAFERTTPKRLLVTTHKKERKQDGKVKESEPVAV
jgi:CRISPR/Cas system-associated exonuclease Cas4 (RecB family)